MGKWLCFSQNHCWINKIPCYIRKYAKRTSVDGGRISIVFLCDKMKWNFWFCIIQFGVLFYSDFLFDIFAYFLKTGDINKELKRKWKLEVENHRRVDVNVNYVTLILLSEKSLVKLFMFTLWIILWFSSHPNQLICLSLTLYNLFLLQYSAISFYQSIL